MKAKTTGAAQSIHVQLVRHQHELGLDPNQILTRCQTDTTVFLTIRDIFGMVSR